MADVPGKFYRATKVRTGVSPSSPGAIEGEVTPPLNPPGGGLNSVGLTMPSAFTVANSPLTANGTIGVTGAGTVGQYIRGDGSLASFPSLTGFVPYTGATQNVDLGEFGVDAGFVNLDTTPTGTPTTQGTIYWDDSRSTAALIMNGTLQHIGQDTFFYVKNSTGSSIPKGTCVGFAGTDGASGHLLITPFLADGSVPSSYFMGVTSETISNGGFGQVMQFGELDGINTSGFTTGALLYASTTVAGGFQTTTPIAPNNIVLVAAAVNSKNNGAIVVRPTYGSNINNDEGVKITSPTTGDLLQLQAGGLWENKTIDAAGIVTKATNQTITGIKTFSQDIIVNGVNVGRGGGTITSNTIVGEYALNANTTGNSNTAIGQASMVSNTTGASNTAVGRGALEKNTTAIWNCGIGTFSLFGNTTGSSNIAVGNGAGGFIADGITENSITNNSVFLGGNTKALANNQTNQIVIGHNAIGEGSNTVVIGNSSILSNRFFGTMRIGTINNGVGDFITTDANGVLTKRTGAEVRTDIGAGTVTSVAALTLGTSGTDLSSTVANGTTTPVITLNVPTASATNRGALSAADWNTFNNKQNALTNPVTGTGVSGRVAYWNGTNSITSDADLLFNGSELNVSGIKIDGSFIPYIISTLAGSDLNIQFPVGQGLSINNNGAENIARIIKNNFSLIGASTIQTSTGNLTISTGGGNGSIILTPNGSGNTLINAGNVGIGTVNPEGKLTVEGTSAQPPTSGTTANSLLQLKGSLGNELNLGSNTVAGNYGAYIQASDNNLAVPYQLNLQPTGGNVIIGSYTDNGARLQVSGSTSIAGLLYTTIGNGLIVGGTGFAFAPSSTRGSVQIVGSSDRVLAFGSNGAQDAYIYNSASVTQIVTAPSFSLVVGVLERFNVSAATGAATFSSNVSASYFKAISGATFSEYIYDGMYSTGTDQYINTQGAYNTRFFTNGTERMRITSGGNVLIGTPTDGGFKLDVNGTSRSSVAYKFGTYTQGSTTPNVSNVSIMIISNSSPTTITNFTNAVAGQVLTLGFSDSNTTINRANAYLLNGNNYTSGPNDFLQLVFDGTYWFEISRSSNA